jgi:hypothetical protein
MGYTHYFELKTNRTVNLDNVQKAVQKVLDEDSNIIQREYDDKAKAVNLVDKGELKIIFNGIGKEGHETFYLDTKESDFNFCKTARKPYDTTVCKVLSILKYYFGSDIAISSDGLSEDLEDVMNTKGDGHSSGWDVASEYMRQNFSEIVAQ